MDTTQLKGLFAQPPAPYRPMVFWLWNGEITSEGIQEAIADFAQRGVGGVFIHPMGENFRLSDFVQGISPAYLSPEYFDLIRVAVEAAREAGLTVWLYDEGGWPSGTAQGKVVEGHEEFRGRRLHAHRSSPLEVSELPANTVAAVGLPEMGVPVPLDLKDFGSRLIPYPEIIVFTLETDGFPVDVLNPAAIRRFIEVTHEQYAAVVGEHFGTTVVGMFTDETSLGGKAGDGAVPWTRQLLECLSSQMGRDARTYLPLLFAPDIVGEEVQARYSEHERVAARCEYYDCLTRRFQQAYWQQLNDWCAEHNLLHTGHVPGEDNLPDHVYFAHFFRTAGCLHVPGVDAIWRQLFPEQENFPFPRFASSALARRPRQPEGPFKNLALTETNAVYGYGMHYGEMRWLADYQFQCGINMYCPMACYYTTEGGRLYGTMSHFGPGHPLWRYYATFADYIGRFSALVRHTVEHPRIAVYYPIETLWASPEAAQQTWECLRQIGLLLVETQQGFNFIDGDLLPEMTVGEGRLEHQAECYDTVLVPASLAMSARALGRLQEFAAAGGRVLFIDYFPAHAAEMNAADLFAQALGSLRISLPEELPVPLSDLEEALSRSGDPDSELRLTDPLPQLHYTRRKLGELQVHLLTNDSPEPLEPLLTVGGDRLLGLEAWDLRDGEILPLLKVPAGEKTDLQPLLAPWTTEVLVTRPVEAQWDAPLSAEVDRQSREFLRWLATPADGRSGAPPHVDVIAEYTEADSIRVAEEYLIQQGSVVVISPDESRHPYAHGPAPLLSWDEWGLSGFSGRVEYSFALTVAEEYLAGPLLLDLGEVHWAATVHLNGRLVGESLWAPHTLDLTGLLSGADNTLVIGVSNTLANQVCREDVQTEAVDQGWCNVYLKRALPMMQDHRSGLMGPLRVMIGQIQPDR
jgi:hypothetical protein